MKLTMSRYPLALNCAYGFRSDVESVDRPGGREARIGTLVHAMAEMAVTSGPEAEMSVPDGTDVSEWETACAIYRGPLSTFLDSRRWTACEIGLRYDAANDTASRGPRRGEPGYQHVGPMVLPGTLDLVLVEHDVAWVIDLKTGKRQNAHAAQLYAQAVAVSREYGARTVHVGFLFARRTRCAEPTWETLDEDRLDEEAGRIVRTLRRLPIAEPVRGDWCWRCDAQTSCPAWTVTAA